MLVYFSHICSIIENLNPIVLRDIFFLYSFFFEKSIVYFFVKVFIYIKNDENIMGEAYKINTHDLFDSDKNPGIRLDAKNAIKNLNIGKSMLRNIKGTPHYESNPHDGHYSVDYYEGKHKIRTAILFNNIHANLMANEVEGQLNQALQYGFQFAKHIVSACKKETDFEQCLKEKGLL